MSSGSHEKCSHCELQLSDRIVVHEEDEDLRFCCVGCRAVYAALHEAGLDQFYDHRQSWSAGEARPVDEDILESDGPELLDAPDFLADQSRRLGDGTCSVDLVLQGAHCAGCVWLVERMPHHVEGVSEARLELSRGRLNLRWDPEQIQLSQVDRWLRRFGFEIHPVSQRAGSRGAAAERAMLVRVGICWAVAANVMLLTIAIYAGLDRATDPGLYATVLWSTFALSAVSLVVGGTVFFRRAWGSLKARRPSMDVPISLGILVGWSHSAWATISGHGEVWFDSIVILTAALLTARYLQIRGNRLAADAADRLLSLLPKVARKLVYDEAGNESVQTVRADKLVPGDRVLVRAGDVVPADGRIITGDSDLSRAVLTGESRPESVGPGAVVEAGTTNLSSPLTILVSAVGAQTRMGQLMEWLDTGTRRRAPVVQIADRLGGAFIIFVLVAAVATAVAWSFVDPSRAVANVVALLVIACPCALGMATPLALTVGIGQAARRGVHVKHDDVIEALEKVTDIVFDKTGTLTEGRPAVVDAMGDLNLAARACALEEQSNHPFAHALLRWAEELEDHRPVDRTKVEEVEEIGGAGIRGMVDGQSVAIGRLDWFDAVDESMGNWAQERAERGLTPLGVAVDGQVRAVIAVGDKLRPETRKIIRDLGHKGIRVHLLSGDHQRVVRAVGESLNIERSRTLGAVAPEDKLAYIESLRSGGNGGKKERIVAMVGDGVNDAAALQAAHIGIAVHGGAEASLAAADVFLVRAGVAPVAELLDGSHRIMGVVRRNLTGSGAYNLFGITLAALGFITPLLAAILMPVSSLAVVASSLLQNSFKR